METYTLSARGRSYRVQAESPLAIRLLLRLAGVADETIARDGSSSLLELDATALSRDLASRGIVSSDRPRDSIMWRFIDSMAPVMSEVARTIRPTDVEVTSARHLQDLATLDEYLGCIIKLGYCMHLRSEERKREPSVN